MDVLTVRVVTEDLVRQLESAGPFLLPESSHGQSFEHVQILLVVIRPLFLNPLVIATAHKLSPVEFDRGLIASDATILLSGAASRVAFRRKAIKFLDVNRVREIRIERVIAVTIEEEVLFERLIAVERLANVRHRRVKILGHDVEIRLAPESVDNRVFGGATMPPGGDEAKDVVRPLGRPSVGREWPLWITEDFNVTEQSDRQIGECGRLRFLNRSR